MEISCDFCGWKEKYGDLIHMKDLGCDGSSIVYCRKCWSERDEKLKCERCFVQYQAYTCGSYQRDEFLYVCSLCRCDGKNCDYCQKF